MYYCSQGRWGKKVSKPHIGKGKQFQYSSAVTLLLCPLVQLQADISNSPALSMTSSGYVKCWALTYFHNTLLIEAFDSSMGAAGT